MNRLRVYLAGPISLGDLAHNINQGTEAFIALAKAGLAPLCPMWSVYAKEARNGQGTGNAKRPVYCYATAEGNDRMSHEEWLGIDLSWVSVCAAVLRLPGESRGADTETAYARSRLIPVFDSVDEVLEWANGVSRDPQGDSR